MTWLAEIGFWGCVLAVLYGYALYPGLIWLLSQTFGQKPLPPPIGADEQLPDVSLLIAAYNEERVIRARVENALTLDYPSTRLHIVIASDGSSDKTNEIVRSFTDPRVRLLAYSERQGKSGVLNAAFKELQSEIVVLSDANTHTDPSAIRTLVRWFQVPSTGVVCGRLVLTDSASGTNVDGVYWRYETFLKICEARLGALLGANGAIYAIRKRFYPGLPKNTLIDDFMIPLLARLRHGCEIVYDPESVAYEETAEDLESEFKRRARIGTGGFQSLTALWPMLSPRWGWTAFAFMSHKVIRWLCPFFLIGALVLNVYLVRQPIYALTLLAQLALYAVALAGSRMTGSGTLSRVARLAAMFTGMNLALLVGFWRWVSTEPQGAWTRTARS